MSPCLPLMGKTKYDCFQPLIYSLSFKCTLTPSSGQTRSLLLDGVNYMRTLGEILMVLGMALRAWSLHCHIMFMGRITLKTALVQTVHAF